MPKFIQAAFANAKERGTAGRCTGAKLGSETCPKGSKQYNFAMQLRKWRKQSSSESLAAELKTFLEENPEWKEAPRQPEKDPTPEGKKEDGITKGGESLTPKPNLFQVLTTTNETFTCESEQDGSSFINSLKAGEGDIAWPDINSVKQWSDKGWGDVNVSGPTGTATNDETPPPDMPPQSTAPKSIPPQKEPTSKTAAGDRDDLVPPPSKPDYQADGTKGSPMESLKRSIAKTKALKD